MRTNLYTALDGINGGDRTAAVHFIIGWITDEVPEDVWNTAIEKALEFVEAESL